MVFGSFEKYVYGPRREAIKRAKEAKERAKEAKERAKEAKERAGEAKERAKEVSAAWKAWNERRLQAEARGEPFNEPVPGDEEVEGHIEGTGEHKMPEEPAQYPAPKVWSHNNGQAEFILRSMSESLVQVTHRDQVGYIGVNQNWDVGKPYTWTFMDRTAGPGGADMERTARPDGIHGNPFGVSTPEEALTLLCNLLLETQGKRTQSGSTPRSASRQRERF